MMSSLVVKPSEDFFFVYDRSRDVKHAINVYYDYVKDSRGILDDRNKRCFIYDYDCDRTILVFPLIPPVDMRGFKETSRWHQSFEYIGCDVSDLEKEFLLPSDYEPSDDPTSLVADFLEIYYDEESMVQDVTIIQALDICKLGIVRKTDKETVKEIYGEWNRKKDVTRLEIGSYLLGAYGKEYASMKMDIIEKKVDILNCMEKVSSSSENIISDIIYEEFVDTVVHSEKEWYRFKDGMWERDAEGYSVWNIISHDVPSSLRNIRNIQEYMAELVIYYLGSQSVRSRILKDLAMKLGDSGFSNKINSKKGLIGMENGTYDLNMGILRSTLPGDYISLRCGVSFEENIYDRETKELMKILGQIFPRDEVLRFFIRSCASMLEGYNEHKVFYIWWGSGNNAKTLLQNFVSSVLGDYSVNLPISLITGKRSGSSQATPDMYYAKDKLVVFLQEPNPDEKIQVGRIKELTGNDNVYVRDLFKSSTSMKFKAKIVIVTNNHLEAPGMDSAFTRRIVAIPFESTFSEKDGKKSGIYNFPLDPRMESKMYRYKEVFMRIILDEYLVFKEKGLEIPEYIRDTTSTYVMLNNYVLKYIKQHLYSSEGLSLGLKEIYSHFKEWFSECYPGKKMPSIESLSIELKKEDYVEFEGTVEDVAFVL